MGWWYRDRVNKLAYEPWAALDSGNLCELPAWCLLVDGNHTLFAFEDFGMNTPVWLPNFVPGGGACFSFSAIHGKFGPGTLTLTHWLASKRDTVIAKELLLLREPPERRIARPKVFKPGKKAKERAERLKRQEADLFSPRPAE